ncbi:hypothetical protein [Nonomuraea sp. NEAU-A123]|nr:hypothetical protein [Nonomuraea sp. NEAU-A123]MBT2231780.1 hypothetical protein [Nonomuraea sp. NEAU-A123]
MIMLLEWPVVPSGVFLDADADADADAGADAALGGQDLGVALALRQRR